MSKEYPSGAFWLIFILISIIGLFYLQLFGFYENNFRAITVGGIFIMMLAISLIIIGKPLFTAKETFPQMCVSFWLGFGLWGAISWIAQLQPKSIFAFFSIEPQAMLSSVAQQMPMFWNFFVTVWTASFIEEAFFLLTIPVLIFLVMNQLGKFVSVLGNKVLQMTLVIIISSLTFAFFHTGQVMFIGFVIAAIVFRGIQLGLYWGDAFWDVIPFTAILASFATAAHLINNWMAFGFMNGLNIMFSEPFGWVLLGVLGIFAIVPIAYYLGGDS